MVCESIGRHLIHKGEDGRHQVGSNNGQARLNQPVNIDSLHLNYSLHLAIGMNTSPAYASDWY